MCATRAERRRERRQEQRARKARAKEQLARFQLDLGKLRSTQKTSVNTPVVSKRLIDSFTDLTPKEKETILYLSSGVFMDLMRFQIPNTGEISGWGVVEDGWIKNVWFGAVGSAGGVISTAERHLQVMEIAFSLGYECLNLQWHSHHGMGFVEFSSVDDKSQAESMITANMPMYYVVFDQLSFNARLFNGMTYTEGSVSLEGAVLQNGKSYKTRGYSSENYIYDQISNNWSRELGFQYDKYVSENGSREYTVTRL